MPSGSMKDEHDFQPLKSLLNERGDGARNGLRERGLKGPRNDDEANRALLKTLSDDRSRAALFKAINESGGQVSFPSRDAARGHRDPDNVDDPLPPQEPAHSPVLLVTGQDQIRNILKNEGKRYSSRVYAELGGGQFLLAQDPWSGCAHGAQQKALRECLPKCGKVLAELAHRACQAAAVTGLRHADFDLASFAEQAALRYCQMLMGYALKDYKLLESSLRAAYRALVYQVMERHFVSDPTLIPAAKALTAKLQARTSELIDAYWNEDKDALKGTDDPARPPEFSPFLRELAQLDSPLNGEQRAILAVGTAIGSVGNVQAAVCIAVQGLFDLSSLPEKDSDITLMERAKTLAGTDTRRAAEKAAEWKQLLAPLLHANPPIPYLPRLMIDETGRKTGEVLLALGGATAPECEHARGHRDDLIWGVEAGSGHWCEGQPLAWPLIIEIVRHVLALPHLAQALDPATGEVEGLKKRHGFACESYPLTHRSDRLRAQSSLNVAMRLKSPSRDHAEHVREIIRAGAPRIEQLLRESRHVHFAWFELIESDTVLVLHTVYDGPFIPYLQHFARQAGDLFDALFEHIEDPPPMPVSQFPHEFAAHIQRYNRAPATGYFFSAYPRAEVPTIVRATRS